jgi:ribonuclease E
VPQAPEDEGGDEVASDAQERGPQGGENGPRRDGEPRRRRRGRRGGRRNRRDREGGGEPRPGGDNGGVQPYAGGGDIAEATHVPRIEPSAVGQEINEPVAYEPRPAPAPPQPAASSEPEPPKRRSTIREPAPTFISGAGFAPAPRVEPYRPQGAEPTPAAESSDDASKPRKTGWWAKRMMADKG